MREAVRALEQLADKDRERWLELLSYIDALVYYDREPAEQQRWLKFANWMRSVIFCCVCAEQVWQATGAARQTRRSDGGTGTACYLVR
jgi:hypothetical protein